MSHFLDRLMFFKQEKTSFSNGHGVSTNEDRSWEHAYRDRWAHDKIVRSTHGVNCTANRLPAHASRHAQSRTTRLLSRCVVLLVSVQRKSREISNGARASGAAVA